MLLIPPRTFRAKEAAAAGFSVWTFMLVWRWEIRCSESSFWAEHTNTSALPLDSIVLCPIEGLVLRYQSKPCTFLPRNCVPIKGVRKNVGVGLLLFQRHFDARKLRHLSLGYDCGRKWQNGGVVVDRCLPDSGLCGRRSRRCPWVRYSLDTVVFRVLDAPQHLPLFSRTNVPMTHVHSFSCL